MEIEINLVIQTLEELRQTLCRKEQQEVYREDMLRREIDDLQKRYQASKHRCEKLVMQVSESTRPLLKQIEANAGCRGQSYSHNERLSQTLSRINVLEARCFG
ncbi:unnamed protein product [Lactuca virosa]|uniref:Uncharacterized protein n=1 Tax=Lactuca virosa TaxID=75947 RepID=A0AAU9NMZ5_9ASTR|nr:unnamed protein product [Lactuca virosa]